MNRPVDGVTTDGKRERWDALRAVLSSQRHAPPLRPRTPDEPLLASFAQQRFWFLERLEPGSPAQTLTVAHHLIGDLDMPALQSAFSEIVRRHEALRTTLSEDGDRLVQIVHATTDFSLPRIDLRALDPQSRDAELQRLGEEDAARPFDLRHGPLLRSVVLRVAEDENRLLVSVHHAVFDGWSFDVFMAELGALYGAFAAGRPSPLPEPLLQYADFSLWQRQRLQGDELDRLLAYWTQRLSGAPPTLALPADRTRHADRERRGAILTLDISPDLSERLRSFSAQEGATLFTTLLSAFGILLHRYTHEADILIGSPVANRNHVELTRMIGMFVNTLVLRMRFAGRPSFRALIREAHETVVGALAHQDLPFELLVDALNPPRIFGEVALASVMFAFQNVPRSKWALPGLSVESWNLESRRPAFDLTLFIEDTAYGLTGSLHYDASLFDPWRINGLRRHFTALLDAMVANPDQPVARAPMLSPTELHELLIGWNKTEAPYPEQLSLHALFALTARRTPDAIAVLGPDGDAMTFAELDQRANQLARYLQKIGVVAEAPVGVLLERSQALIVALLAILKAGGAYVPIDPSSPADRALTMLRQTDARVVVTEDAKRWEFSELEATVLRLDVDRDEIDRECKDYFDTEVPAAGLACVMFTSGSTGGPKAVAVTHKGIVRLVCGLGVAAPTSSDVLLHLAPASFDAATFEIWGSLVNGATLALAPPGIFSPHDLGEAIRRHGVTMLWLTAGLFELVVDLETGALAPLRRLLVGGDVVSPVHAARFLGAAPGCRLINGYGPTENTTFTCLHPITWSELSDGQPIPIGRPIANTRVYVLDDELQPTAIGIAGEACIAGDGLARGYLNDRALTHEKFVPDPFDPNPSARLYRTGDRVRQRPDGVFEFLGRSDGQVKIRGIRFDPRDMEVSILRCTGITMAAVVVEGNGASDKRIVAYFVSSDGAEMEPRLRAHLSHEFPDSLMPSLFVRLKTIPLNASGKIDRRALPSPDVCRRSSVDLDDPIEATLLKLFEDVLGRHVEIDNNFFDRGGDSLRAVRLAYLIEDAFGEDMPLSALFEAQTVAGLAARIRIRASARTMSVDRHPSLVVIRHGASARPLFIVPGGHGGPVELALYSRLLRPLEGGRSIYCLRAPGFEESGPHSATVSEIAEAHLKAMRSVQLQGPYLVMGECAGGAVAFEIAQQLLERDQTAASLVLLDSWCPSAAGEFHYRWVERPLFVLKDRLRILKAASADLSDVIRGHIEALQRLPLRQRRPQLLDAIESLFRITKNWGVRLTQIEVPELGQNPDREKAYVRTLMRYRPRTYPGRVTLIATESSLRQGIEGGWRSVVAGGLVVRGVPGDHESYLNEHAGTTLHCLAAILREYA